MDQLKLLCSSCNISAHHYLLTYIFAFNTRVAQNARELDLKISKLTNDNDSLNKAVMEAAACNSNATNQFLDIIKVLKYFSNNLKFKI